MKGFISLMIDKNTEILLQMEITDIQDHSVLIHSLNIPHHDKLVGRIYTNKSFSDVGRFYV